MDTKTLIKGLHHVTATVSNAQEDYNFYTNVLGLRLVKQTVNFDNNQVYHFYYGNELGNPGTIMTTFPYKGQQVRQGRSGTGQVAVTAFSIPKDALDFWRKRLADFKIDFQAVQRFGPCYPWLLYGDAVGSRIESNFRFHDGCIWLYHC